MWPSSRGSPSITSSSSSSPPQPAVTPATARAPASRIAVRRRFTVAAAYLKASTRQRVGARHADRLDRRAGLGEVLQALEGGAPLAAVPAPRAAPLPHRLEPVGRLGPEGDAGVGRLARRLRELPDGED